MQIPQGPALLVALLLTVIPLVIANDAPDATSWLQTRRATISVPRFRRKDHVRDGLNARNRVFRRLGWPIPSSNITKDEDFPFNAQAHVARKLSADTTAQPTATGSVQTIPRPFHAEYLTEVIVGGQALHMDFDTGSSDFWVVSTLLHPAIWQKHKQAYDPAMSATFRNLSDLHWFIVYGDDSAAMGVVGSDTVRVGGVTVPGQAVELATNLTSTFVNDFENDGLVGLGFSNINNVRPTKQRTLFDNMRPLLKRELFVANLAEDGTGSWDFGFINKSILPTNATEKDLAQVPVNPRHGFWEFQSDAYGVGGKVAHRDTEYPAFADSGTSLMLVDPAVASAYYGKVKGAGYSYYYGGYVYPCSSTLPSFSIAVGNVTEHGGPGGGWGGKAGAMVEMPPWMLTYAKMDYGFCYGSVQSNEGFPVQVFG